MGKISERSQLKSAIIPGALDQYYWRRGSIPLHTSTHFSQPRRRRQTKNWSHVKKQMPPPIKSQSREEEWLNPTWTSLLELSPLADAGRVEAPAPHPFLIAHLVGWKRLITCGQRLLDYPVRYDSSEPRDLVCNLWWRNWRIGKKFFPLEIGEGTLAVLWAETGDRFDAPHWPSDTHKSSALVNDGVPRWLGFLTVAILARVCGAPFCRKCTDYSRDAPEACIVWKFKAAKDYQPQRAASPWITSWFRSKFLFQNSFLITNSLFSALLARTQRVVQDEVSIIFSGVRTLVCVRRAGRPWGDGCYLLPQLGSHQGGWCHQCLRLRF